MELVYDSLRTPGLFQIIWNPSPHPSGIRPQMSFMPDKAKEVFLAFVQIKTKLNSLCD